MSEPLPQVRSLARALLDSQNGGLEADAQLEAAERVLQRLAERVSPLVGSGGFFLLLQRTLKRTRAEHPCLDGIRVESDAPWRLPRSAEDTQERSAEEVAAAAQALLAELIALLARFLGSDMAIRLVRQSFPEIEAGAVGSGAEETTNE